jgi:predicted GNAT superfamily acetyltransferase
VSDPSSFRDQAREERRALLAVNESLAEQILNTEAERDQARAALEAANERITELEGILGTHNTDDGPGVDMSSRCSSCGGRGHVFCGRGMAQE